MEKGSPQLLQEHAWGRADSPSRWRRRAAAVSLVQEARHGRRTGFVLRVAKKLLPDRDDMVVKGVGWLRKEPCPRLPAEVVAFLLRGRNAASQLRLRCAAAKTTPDDRP